VGPALALPSSRSSSPTIPREREVIYERERERSESPLDRTSPLKRVQVVLGPDSTLDTTVHLELDIEEDVEGQLEELSRLKILGHFNVAEQHFQTNLRDYSDVPPVAVEYAEMLLQQGAYKRLKELLLKQELKPLVCLVQGLRLRE
jgi:hypothetical protein